MWPYLGLTKALHSTEEAPLPPTWDLRNFAVINCEPGYFGHEYTVVSSANTKMVVREDRKVVVYRRGAKGNEMQLAGQVLICQESNGDGEQ